MVARAAGREDDAFGPAELLGVEIEAAEVGAAIAVVEPAAHGVFQRFGLLVDLLEHVMLVLAFVGIARIPVDLLNDRLDTDAMLIDNVPVVRSEHAHLTVAQVDDLLGVAE